MSAIGGGLFFGGTEDLGPYGPTNEAEDEQVEFPDFSDESDADEDIPYENPQTGARGTKREHSPTTQTDDSAKRPRVLGGKAPVSKPITGDGDSDDERIYELKNQGYPDEQVARKLIEEGRVRYVPKTIASRYVRLKQIKDQREDDRLDDELSDWHVGEDGELMTSVKAIEQKLGYDIQKLKDRKWKDVSAKLADRLQKKKYTGKACKERYDGLHNGTALKPIEIDSDQEGRAEMRISRIAEAKRLRAEANEKAKQERSEMKTDAEIKKELRRRVQQEKMEHKAAVAAEKAEAKRIRDEKRRERDRLTALRVQFEDEAREKRQAKSEQRKVENLLIRRFGGKARKPEFVPRRRKNGGGEGSDEEVDMRGLNDDGTPICGDDDTDGDTISVISATPTQMRKRSKRGIAVITPETLLNPRSIMNDDELVALLYERGLPRREAGESHPQVVARIAAADTKLSTADLDQLLGKHFISTKGAKERKVKRLQEAEACECSAGQEGVKSTDLEFKKGYEGYTGKYSYLLGGDGDGEEV